ncbi:MAG: hypothetical protein ABS76_29625 [Pelagibacterium sp. SCN 64-44]|nr:MAG: hypothetical protein ABS76_29625 [Pelagibacterium sp. SCN 64-44]
MTIPVEDRAMLERMERARQQTERHIEIIEDQIAARAERITITAHAGARQFGRGTHRWRRADLRAFHNAIAALHFARRTEIDALSRKLARQAGAIAAFRAARRFRSQAKEIAP